MAETTFELISLCSAEPGWRAVISGGSGAEVPVVAWGVFRKRRGSQDLGTSMQGLLAVAPQPGTPIIFNCAAAVSGFEGYFAPDMPEPSPQ